MVGRDINPVHAEKIKAPFNTNLSAYGLLQSRYMNLSIAKYWRISLNGREDFLALFRRR
jgi:hypothetical protein